MSSMPSTQGAPAPSIVFGDAMRQTMKLTQGINDFAAPPALSTTIGQGTLNKPLISEDGRGGVAIGGASMGTKQLAAEEAKTIQAAPASNMASAGIGESHEQSVMGM